MKKLWAIIAPLALGAGICGLLRADDSQPPVPTIGQKEDDYQTSNEYLWFLEHNAAMAKDPEAMGVQAVFYAKALLNGREPQVQIDFFNKALYDTKMRPVQREIRMALCQIYKQQGQNDKAMDQLQQLMMDQ